MHLWSNRWKKWSGKFVCWMLAAVILGGAAAAAPGDLDSSFNPGVIGTSTLLYDALVQPDGKIIVIGGFTDINGTAINRIARLNPNGSLDTTFNVGTGADNSIRSIVREPDGKFTIGGAFLNFNGTPRNRVARLNADGSLDTSFDTASVNFNGGVSSVARQPDGKYLVGGFFTAVNGTPYTNLARLNANGSLDTAFNPVLAPSNNQSAVFLLTVGEKIYAGGSFTTYAGETRNRFVRLNADGSPDTAYPNFNGSNNLIFGISRQQPDGKFYVFGNFTVFGGDTRNAVARLNADGSLDASFTAPSVLTVNAIYSAATQTDGKVLIGGNFTAVSGVARQRIARLNPDGTLDLSFNPGSGTNAGGTVYALEQLPSGKILAGGFFSTFNGIARTRLVRLLNTGVENGDFDADTRTDLAVYRGGNWFVNRSTTGFTSRAFGVASDVLAPGDFDGDHRIDYAVFRSGAWYVLSSATNVFNGVSWGAANDVPVTGDYTGDGRDDYAVFRPAAAQWLILPSAGGGNPLLPAFGEAGDVPVPGDYDGDGVTNIGVFRPSSGSWLYPRDINSPNTNIGGGQWGISTDKPVPADYDGDGRTDLAVFRAAEATWYIQRSSNNSLQAAQWGVTTDRPVPGDYDGDNKDDIAVYRDGAWFVLQSSNNQLRAETFGAAGDLPVPGAYIRP